MIGGQATGPHLRLHLYGEATSFDIALGFHDRSFLWFEVQAALISAFTN